MSEDKQSRKLSDPVESLDRHTNCCTRCCCTFNRAWKITIWLCVVTVYLLIGGAIFLAVEGPNERQQLQKAEDERNAALAQLEMQVYNLTVIIAEATNLTREEAENFTNALVSVSQRVALAIVTLPNTTAPIWEYGPSVFFATTVITTIGYGTIFPETDGGRVLFIVYAIIGIPIALIFLTLLGDALSSGLDWLLDLTLSPIKKQLGRDSVWYRTITFVIACLLALIFFIFIPAAIFHAIEPWNYLEAVYFTFVTLTTVGFGDFVPAQSTEIVSEGRGIYAIANSVWIWLGLAMISLIITEIQKLITAFTEALRKRIEKGHNKLKERVKKDSKKQELSQLPEGNTHSATNRKTARGENEAQSDESDDD